ERFLYHEDDPRASLAQHLPDADAVVRRAVRALGKEDDGGPLAQAFSRACSRSARASLAMPVQEDAPTWRRVLLTRSLGIFRVRERLLHVGPELVDVLPPRAPAQHALRYALAFPAAAALEHGIDAAEARRILDQAERRLDASCVDAYVEGEEASEPGITDALDCVVGAEALRELGCGVGLSLDACPQCLEAAYEQPGGIGTRDDPGPGAEVEEPPRGFLVPAHDCPEQQVVVAAEVLRSAVDGVVGA